MARHLILWLYAIITLFAFAAFAQIPPAAENKSTSSWLDLGLQPPALRDRQIDSTCTNDRPCADGSCCHGRSGFCGRTPEHCAPGVCISNCDAKAECGVGADPAGKTCPLNVCCGKWGYCGTTANFCGEGCQSNCPQPGPQMLSEGDVDELVIAYVEAWNFVDEAGCAKRKADWIPVGQITHLNVAFYYIQPGTFAIDRMPGVPPSAYNQLVDLKEKAPGLKVWLAIGGWTFSDNETVTQPLWNEVSKSEGSRAKFISGLVKFMSDQGYDGVDLDWEYPGAGDRGGKPEDVANFVHLVKDIRRAFDLQATSTGHSWGLSFTAPTSYWYMRWFDLKGLMQAVDWVNLMTYDIHGSWDSPENQIGNIVLAHTNLTEIQDALNLFWRNDVPANRINLGIGFYGRTYKLTDPNCRTPGCKFLSGGTKGPCTDTEGVLSYNEISAIRKEFNVNPVYDKVAGVKYMNYNRDQWLSYDDEESIKDKVNYASSQGLRGLFIWAIDQDDDDHTALSAIVPPGKFDQRNGVGTNGNFKPATSSCVWSSCSDSPKCTKGGTIANGHDIKCSTGGRKVLCCPLDAQPDPKSCRWEVGRFANIFDLVVGICGKPNCADDEVLIATSEQHYWENNGDKACNFGSASPKYCCKGKRGGKDVCAPSDTCKNILLMESDPSYACPQGRKLLTLSGGKCGTATPRQSATAWCCEAEVVTKNCFWTPQGSNKLDMGDNCSKIRSCPANYVEIGEDTAAQASSYSALPDCLPPGPCIDVYDDFLDYLLWPDSCEPTWGKAVPRKLCCPANDLNIGLDFLPVPLEYLFDYKDKPKPDDAITTYQIDIDASGSAADDARDANGNAFGWHIISGPPGEVTSFERRDGSHWVLLGCDKDMHEDHTHTVKAVCTDESDGSNCDHIFRDGVATTVVQMPKGCGPGKYAIAVDMKPANDYEGVPKDLIKRLEKRGIPEPRVYDFTFNYDYSPIVKRGDPNKRIRIDYSDDAGYWSQIVSAPPSRMIRSRADRMAWKREQQEEVDRDHNGSWERYLDHKWSLDRRNTPEHQLHELHERWFSSTLGDWLKTMKHVDESYEIFKRSISDSITWDIFEWGPKKCQLGGFPTEMYLKMWTEITYDVEAVAMLNLIGDFGDLNSWKQSHVHFRTKGDVEASLNFLAFAKISFNSDEIELFGMERFGATFGIPGLVTVGPNFKIMARLDGEASLHTEAKISMNVASWDYTQQYPNQEKIEQDKPAENKKAKAKQLKDGPAGSGFDAPKFHADIEIKGRLTLTLTPKVLFGIQWKVDVPDVSVEVGIKSFATIHASAGATVDTGDQSAQLRACWGIDCGYTLYAAVNAPDLSGLEAISLRSDDRKRFRQELSALEGLSPVNYVAAYPGPI